MRTLVPAVLFSAMALSAQARPLSEHEEHVGAQEEQICTMGQLAIARLAIDPKTPWPQQTTERPGPVGTIVASACKARPGKPKETLVAISWQGDATDDPDSKHLVWR